MRRRATIVNWSRHRSACLARSRAEFVLRSVIQPALGADLFTTDNMGQRDRCDERAVLPPPRASCVDPVSNAVCCLRREMSGSADPPFRVPMSRGCKVRFMLGPQACSPRSRHTPTCGLSTLHSDEGISPCARSLLRGAPALTAAGLPPASPWQQDPTRFAGRDLSGRTIHGILPFQNSRSSFPQGRL